MDFQPSERASSTAKRVRAFIDEHIAPVEAQHWQETVQKLQAQLSALDFKFKNPKSGFDRTRVKGVVAKLLRVKDVSANSASKAVSTSF